jgi:prophage DNA circulation protein
LIDALEERGSGILAHPYLGSLYAVVDNFTQTETTAEGRVARFQIQFREEKELPLTVSVANAQTQVINAKRDFFTAASDWLEEGYTLVRKPVTAVEDATETIDKCLDIVDDVKRIAGTTAEFKRAIRDAKGKVIELALDAKLLAAQFVELIDFGADPVGQTRQTLTVNSTNSLTQQREQKQITAAQAQPLVSTPAEISDQPDYPAKQIQKFVALTATVTRSGLLTAQQFTSTQDAQAAQAEYFDDLNAAMLDPDISDPMYDALRQIKAAVELDIGARAINLPRQVDYFLRADTNALALSQEIYGDINQEEELTAQNEIEHPLFFAAPKTLTVLTDV